MGIEFKNKPGIVAYLTAGDPDLSTTREIALAAIDNGADVIELGVPFSDPLADGPVIQRASERAVGRGVRLTDVLGVAKEIRAARPSAGLVLFSYLNPVVRRGMKRLCEEAAEAGVDGVLLTDMIVEEAGEYLEAMRASQLAPIFLAAPTSPDRRLKAIAEASLATGKTGFVYAISRVGITGTQAQVAGDAAELVARMRQFTHLPIAVGFGISNAEHVAAVGKFADAAVIGSAVVSLIEKSTAEKAPAAVGSFIAGLRGNLATDAAGVPSLTGAASSRRP
jgi:tryptophan synthase alpha chain